MSHSIAVDTVERDEHSVDEQQDDTAVDDSKSIDRQPGSGSLSKQEAWGSQVAQQRSPSNDGRYDTRTTFYYGEQCTYSSFFRSRDRHQLHRKPADRRSWSTLAKWNDGMRDIDGSRKQRNFEADVRRWVQTFGNQLDCHGTQIERVEHIVTGEIDLDHFGRRRLSAEKVILSTISLVVDDDMSVDDPEQFDLSDWIIYRDQFEELMDSIDMDMDELWTIRKLVRNEISL